MPLALSAFKDVRERELCEENLLHFLKHAWRYIDPAIFIPSWHLEAIGEHLQAVTDGHIQRLVINVPPRTSKSSLCSVAWPAWTWCQSQIGPLSGPHVQFLSASYAHTLSLRDSVKTRRLIQSSWYQKHWGKAFTLTSDQNAKGRFENDKGGYRLATSVDGTTTGEGGDIILIDDAHLATEAESDVVREATLTWWDEAMSTRLNSLQTGAYVVIMQRLHQLDLTGHILDREAKNWVHLMLPMEHDTQRHCITYVKGEKFWEDPRQEDGELLCPDRFDAPAVENLKLRLGSYAAAGQLQQSPSPRGGGYIKDAWWKHWVEKKYPQCEFVLASLDTAYTEKTENDASALTVWGIFRDNPDNVIPIEVARRGPEAVQQWYQGQWCRVILLYQWADRLAFPDLVRKVMETCTITPNPLATTRYRFRIDRLVIENKAAGLSVAQELGRQLGFSGQFGVELFDPRKQGGGDKIARLLSVQHMFEAGLVYVPWPVDEKGEEKPQGYKWVEDMIDEVGTFPKAPHDDRVDSMTMALRWLRDSGILQRPEEFREDVEQELVLKPSLAPLYPV